MDVFEEFKANLPKETRAAVGSMLTRLGNRDKQRLKTYLTIGSELPPITIFNIQHAFADGGYPNMNWKRIMKRYDRMGHERLHDEDRFDFD